eukprot:Rmarinus@m.24784
MFLYSGIAANTLSGNIRNAQHFVRLHFQRISVLLCTNLIHATSNTVVSRNMLSSHARCHSRARTISFLIILSRDSDCISPVALLLPLSSFYILRDVFLYITHSLEQPLNKLFD